jgi:hypothetical protein
MKKFKITDRPIKAGERIVISTDEYSDYTILGIYEAQKNFDLSAVIESWGGVKIHKYGINYTFFSCDTRDLVRHMVDNGLIIKIESPIVEVWINSEEVIIADGPVW